jgi:hypothetical protein
MVCTDALSTLHATLARLQGSALAHICAANC